MDKCSFQSEIRVTHRTERAGIPIAVHVIGNSMVLGRRIVLGKENLINAVTVVIGAREQEIQSIGEGFAKGDARFVTIELAVLGGNLRAIKLTSRAGDDVYHG